MNVALNGELLEEVECFTYLGFKINVDEELRQVKSRINDVGRCLVVERWG